MKIKGAGLSQIKITGGFWKEYQDLIFQEVIPYQWEILNDRIEGAEKSFTIYNFSVAAGRIQGPHKGFVFQDSDLYKWLEAVGNMLQIREDPKMEEAADWTIDLLEQAQEKDGYLNTYYQIKEPEKKWTNILECHELYCAGHLMEAAVAYFKGTGKRKILDIACRFADCIAEKFGKEEGKLHGYPGHQEIELGLQKLYDVTGNRAYQDLAEYFLEERGRNDFFEEEFKNRNCISHWTNAVEKEPNKVYNQFSYKEYNQFHLPVWEQTKAVGHAVRALYMYTAMARLAEEKEDEGKLQVCRKLWENIICRQMYINGSVGATVSGEAFTRDYDLPNDTNYSETCAALGLIFFSQELFQAEGKGCYGDIIEKSLYNTVLAALGRDGRHFFYTNPMEMNPYFAKVNPERYHLKPQRPKWHACACCPPNIARTIAGLGKYIFGEDDSTVFVQIFAQSSGEFFRNGKSVKLDTKTEYPWDGKVCIQVLGDLETKIALRIPGWCRQWKAEINGKPLKDPEVLNGYLYLSYKGEKLQIELTLEMMPVLMQANPKVAYNLGKAAIMRGPLLYCIEEKDNGACLGELYIKEKAEILTEKGEKEILLKVEAVRKASSIQEGMYYEYRTEKQETLLTAIPYFSWGNRGEGEMLVWIKKE